MGFPWNPKEIVWGELPLGCPVGTEVTEGQEVPLGVYATARHKRRHVCGHPSRTRPQEELSLAFGASWFPLLGFPLGSPHGVACGDSYFPNQRL